MQLVPAADVNVAPADMQRQPALPLELMALFPNGGHPGAQMPAASALA